LKASLNEHVTISGVKKAELSSVLEALAFVGATSYNTPCHIMLSSTPIEGYMGMFEPPEEASDGCFVYVKRRVYDIQNGSWLSTLVHELMHYRQFLEGRLTQAMLSAQGTLDAALDSYLSLAHEIEARRAEYSFRRDTMKETALADNYFVRSYTNIGHPLF
jgi:hypothetical protein